MQDYHESKTVLTINDNHESKAENVLFFWDHFGWELCNRAYYYAIGKLRP